METKFNEDQITNGALPTISTTEPYTAHVQISGVCPILFHRWNDEAVEAKGNAVKGSKAKKTDDIESYVYRNEQKEICIPGEYFRQSLIHAAKFMQDPRSPRKSAMDLFKAGVLSMSPLCGLGVKNWDYLDRRRVLIQRNAITRVRPAMTEGWKISVSFLIVLPEYITPAILNERLQAAGRLIGVGDFRPTYGRFLVTSFKHGLAS